MTQLEAQADRFHADDEWELLRSDIIEAFREGMSLAKIMAADWASRSCAHGDLGGQLAGRTVSGQAVRSRRFLKLPTL